MSTMPGRPASPPTSAATASLATLTFAPAQFVKLRGDRLDGLGVRARRDAAEREERRRQRLRPRPACAPHQFAQPLANRRDVVMPRVDGRPDAGADDPAVRVGHHRARVAAAAVDAEEGGHRALHDAAMSSRRRPLVSGTSARTKKKLSSEQAA